MTMTMTMPLAMAEDVHQSQSHMHLATWQLQAQMEPGRNALGITFHHLSSGYWSQSDAAKLDGLMLTNLQMTMTVRSE